MNYEAKLFAGKICRTSAHPRPNPSLFYFPGLSSKPWHDPKDFSFVSYLQNRYLEIKNEYLENQKEIEKMAEQGDLIDPFHKVKEGVCLKFPLINKGVVNNNFEKLMPKTRMLFSELTKIGEGPITNVPFSSSYLSIMKPITSIDKHCGPCNIKLRCELPIILPEASEACFIRVGGEIKFWKEGELMIFDDTYEHESCNLSDIHDRIIMVFDIWHPELLAQEREAMIHLFN